MTTTNINKSMLTLSELAIQNGYAKPFYQTAGGVYIHTGNGEITNPEVYISDTTIMNDVINFRYAFFGKLLEELSQETLMEVRTAVNPMLRELGLNPILRINRTSWEIAFDYRPRNIKHSVSELLKTITVIGAYFEEHYYDLISE